MAKTYITNGDWWTKVQPGESITAAAQRELERMQQSDFASMNVLAMGQMEESAGSRLKKAARTVAGYTTLGMRI